MTNGFELGKEVQGKNRLKSSAIRNAVYSSPQDLVFQQYVRLEKWFTAGWLSLGLVSLPVGLPTFAEFRSFSGRQASMRNSRGRTSIVRTYDYYAVSRCARVLLYADLCNVT
ncbi:hypothetical protein CAJAP_02368 [Camponotus japonicus]